MVLPNGTGKDVRVVAIAKGDAAKAAEAAGAQEVGDEDVYKRQVASRKPRRWRLPSPLAPVRAPLTAAWPSSEIGRAHV